MTFNLERAEAVLEVALKGGILDAEAVPDTGKGKISLAEEYYEFARLEQDRPTPNPLAKEILFTADVQPFQVDHDADEDDVYYQEALSKTLPDGLPVPPEIEGEAPELPLDLSELADREVIFAHGAFNACSARINYLYSLEEAGEAAAKHLANHYFAEWVTNAERKDSQTNKPKSMGLLEAEAGIHDAKVAKWRGLQSKHALAANKYKRVLEIYDNNCERLSRNWTMRQDQKGHS